MELKAVMRSDDACFTSFTFSDHAPSGACRAFGGLAREKAFPTPACCLRGIVASGDVDDMEAAAMVAAAACLPMCLFRNEVVVTHSHPHAAAKVSWLLCERFCRGTTTVTSRGHSPLAVKSAAMKHGIM